MVKTSFVSFIQDFLVENHKISDADDAAKLVKHPEELGDKVMGRH